MIRHILIAAVALAIGTQASAQTAPAAVPTERDVKELSAIFDRVDADRNGKMTKTELSAFGSSRNLGSLVRPKGWRDMDANGNGTLTKPEFIQGMVSARAAMRAQQVR